MPWDNATVIEIVAGREALVGIRNRALVPLGALSMLRNATLEDDSWRTGGGATKVGTPPAAISIGAAIDYWPDPGTQRAVVQGSDGTLRKDNGSGGVWVTLASGLTVSGAVPYFVLGGAEAVGRERRAFYCDGVNAVKQLKADAATMVALTVAPADWTGTNQPRFLEPHDGFLFGGGNKNAPHTLYRSDFQAHDNFTGAYTIPVKPDAGEYLACARSFKGRLVIWKYPRGVYALDTSDPDDTKWEVIELGEPGASGPNNATRTVDNLIWVSIDGSWQSLAAVQATGGFHASDFSHPKLNAFIREQVNTSRLAFADLIFDDDRQEALLSMSALGQTAKGRKLALDVNKAAEAGPRWIFHDRDRNEALFLRKVGTKGVPHMFDEVGQMWVLNQTARNKDGNGYLFEWQTPDTDLGMISPEFKGRKKALRFLQVEYDPRANATHTLEVRLDGRLRQSIPLTFTAGAPTLPVTLPIQLGGDTLQLTHRRRGIGQFTRLSLRGVSTGADQDVSITRILLGIDLVEGPGSVAA